MVLILLCEYYIINFVHNVHNYNFNESLEIQSIWKWWSEDLSTVQKIPIEITKIYQKEYFKIN